MQDTCEKKIRENVSTLVDLTTNTEEVIKQLREKDVINDGEQAEILGLESLFDKKSKLYWIISQKSEDYAFQTLIEVLKATGNESAAEKLTEENSSEAVDEEIKSPVEVQVTVHHEDQEGIALADEIEKELDRIQSQDAENDLEDAANSAEIVQVFDKVESSYTSQDVEPEVQEEEIEEPMREEISAQEEIHENGDLSVEQEIEEEKIVEDEIPKSPKQVSFGEIKDDDTKEFVLERSSEEAHHEDVDNNNEERSPKSIVALNREKFEKPGSMGSKIKYSFNKKDDSSASSEEPKESTVKNLRNFFQTLGTTGNSAESDVLKRQGSKTGGVNPNRRTMAL